MPSGLASPRFIAYNKKLAEIERKKIKRKDVPVSAAPKVTAVEKATGATVQAVRGAIASIGENLFGKRYDEALAKRKKEVKRKGLPVKRIGPYSLSKH